MIKKKRKKKVPIPNKELYAEIVLSLEQDTLTKRAEDMLILLAERASLRMTYKNPEDRKDCIAFAHLDLLRYWRSFNPKYKNAFAYYTEIAKRGFAKGWNHLHPKKYKGTMSLSGKRGSGGIYSI